MCDDELQHLMLFPGIADIEKLRFEQDPVLIILKFLDCYDSSGRQVYHLPKHITDALAHRLLSFKLREAKTLDLAFGGRSAQRLNAIIEAEDEDGSILWQVTVEMRKLSETRQDLDDGQIRELVFSIVAERERCSPANVRRIWDKHDPANRR